MNTIDEINSLLRNKLMYQFKPETLEENSRFMMNRYLQKAQELYDLFSGEKQLRVQPVIKVCATNPVTLHAFVAPLSTNHHYVVGLSYGVFANLYACFMGLLSHPEVLPHIGNSDDTVCKYTITTYGLLDFTYENDAVKANTPVADGFPLWNYPKDPDRVLYAILLTDIAIQFVLYHEWGHILGGHVDYSNKVMHLSDIAEVEQHGADEQHKMLQGKSMRLAIEFEADYIAAQMIAELAHQLPATNQSFFQAYPANFLNSFDMRDAIYFSIMSFFHLYEEVKQKKGLQESKLYPSPFNRFTSLLFGIYSDMGSETQLAWKDYEFKGVQDFAKTSQLLQFEFLFSDQIYDDEKRTAEIIELDDLLNALKVELEHYRLSG